MTAGLARVVFDTNILVSAHFWKGPPYRCLLAIEAGLAILVVCESILSEPGEKLITKFAVPKAETDSIVERLRAFAELTRLRRIPHVASDLGYLALDRVVDRDDVERADFVALRHERAREMQAEKARAS